MEIFEDLFSNVEFKDLEPTPDFSPEAEDSLLKIFQNSKKEETSDITKDNIVPVQDSKSLYPSIHQTEKSEVPEETREVAIVVEDPQETHKTASRLRWGRKEDKELFKQIYLLEKQGAISLTELSQINTNDFEMTKDVGLNILVEKFNWKSELKALVIRIQNCLSDKFSVRETRLLKKLCKKSSPPNYEEILYNFPGKSMKRVVEA